MIFLMMPASFLSAESTNVAPDEDEHLRFFIDQFCQNENTTLGELLERLLRCRESQAVSVINQPLWRLLSITLRGMKHFEVMLIILGRLSNSLFSFERISYREWTKPSMNAGLM